ncbi:short-chain dehydrogenase/reductase SDR [Citreicella sp. SE45]|uniref:NAD(P)-dependent dehydrogenase, short-chain alcohol dehydrogenase family n=1 Tax=Salipiger thiooxidans TaxID=282683 RepID=A0A1G7FLQ7_9RHOB|nr:SDR family oxidoreductase [Salipiger thiooxidans]EEX11636.1 short-chain dehydrogenase/reductase SDR [Citreicella sp. SE45]MAU48344.1 NAD(P)-dependent oxidoreductase [Salipiger sp.]SDE76774.1 NAD(P)-dependent dehydrogenase, short-chain alcohol dehydrogenase family [Salipiger thiooxidans]
MDLTLKGARVIVTAGAGGIGRAIVEGFLAEGASVATCDIDEAALATLPDAVFRARVDVSDSEALVGFMDAAMAHLGGLDCLVNNAGIAGPTGRIEELDPSDVRQTLDICLTSQFVTIARAVPQLRASGNASIVNVSSLAGRLGFRLRSPYAAAKWGVIGLSKSMAIELGPDGIRVNALLPGLVAGDRQRRVLEARAQAQGVSFEEAERDAFSRTSIKEYVTPQQLADQVLFLASPRGRTISGQALSVCGDTGMLG